MTKSEQMAERLGEKISIVGKARLLVCDRTDDTISGMGLTKIGIDGVIISDMNIPGIDGNFSMLECDVVLVPKTLHSDFKHEYLKNGRIDQYLVGGYADEDNWKKHTDL